MKPPFSLKDIPEDLQYAASQLSWEDAVLLLCMYEKWFAEERSAVGRAKVLGLINSMTELVRAVPYDWTPPPFKEHGLLSALVVHLKTGEMPAVIKMVD